MIRLTYFAAQEIPAALVTFVSLLIFIQTGTSAALSTMYSALLSLPWVAKLWLGNRALYRHTQRRGIHVAELLMVLLLLLLSFVVSPSSPLFSIFNVGSGNGVALFGMLFLLSLVTAWHETLSDIKYHQLLRPSLRRFYDVPRLLFSQSMVVLTYGLLIVLVGTVEVMTRSILVSWAAACRITAGVVLLFLLWHVLSGFMSADVPYRPVTHKASSYAPRFSLHTAFFCLLFLLPQALMFYTRVFFLLTPKAEGGLSRSLQEVGFVHGVVGAFAFSVGLMVSRVLVRRRMSQEGVDRRKVRYSQYALPTGVKSVLDVLDLRVLLRFLPLLLSPLIYLCMSHFPPQYLWQLALCTFLSQFMFGYGMHRLLSFLGLPASVGMRVPLVALVMFLPMAFSGWFMTLLGFQTFFLIDSLTALLPILYVVKPFSKFQTKFFIKREQGER